MGGGGGEFINIQCEPRGASWGRSNALIFSVNQEGTGGVGDALILSVNPEGPCGGGGMH